MKRISLLQTFVFAVVAATLFSCSSSRSFADDVELRRLLYGPGRCDHVIRLLHHYGVNNDSDQTVGVNGFHPFGPIAIPIAEIGDLQLVSIAQRAETVAGCGPAFNIVIKNCSIRDVCRSSVTLVGLFGRICPTSPSVTVKIDLLPAGQATEICVTLPIESLAMGNLNGQVIGFNRVLVAVDSFDELMESNEANNLRVFDLASIPVAAVAVAVFESAATVAAPIVTTEPASAVPMTVPGTQSVADPITVPATGPDAAAPVAPQSATPQAQSDMPQADLQSAINQFTDQVNADPVNTGQVNTDPANVVQATTEQDAS